MSVDPPATPQQGGGMPKRTATEENVVVQEVLADLPIGKESTTSRVVVNNPLMRVVYFSFDAGQELTEHTSPRAVVVTLLTGVLDFSLGDTPHRMQAGDVIYLAPGQKHALVAVEPAQLQLVMVDLEP